MNTTVLVLLIVWLGVAGIGFVGGSIVLHVFNTNVVKLRAAKRNGARKVVTVGRRTQAIISLLITTCFLMSGLSIIIFEEGSFWRVIWPAYLVGASLLNTSVPFHLLFNRWRALRQLDGHLPPSVPVELADEIEGRQNDG